MQGNYTACKLYKQIKYLKYPDLRSGDIPDGISKQWRIQVCRKGVLGLNNVCRVCVRARANFQKPRPFSLTTPIFDQKWRVLLKLLVTFEDRIRSNYL